MTRPESHFRHRKPKIIYAWDYLRWGGAQIYFLGLIKELKSEFEVHLVLPEASDEQLLKFIRATGVDYHFIPTYGDLSSADAIGRKLQRHRNKLKSENIMLRFLINEFDLTNSIVHVELGPWQSLTALIRLCLKTKVFITQHTSLPQVSKCRNLLWKLKLETISRFENFHVFFSNQDAKRNFSRFYPADFLQTTRVTYTYVTADEINEARDADMNSEELKQKFGIMSGKFVVLCVAHFIEAKGCWTFLEAARQVCQSDDDVVFVWISNTRASAENLERAEKFDLGDKFRLIISDETGNDRIELLKLFRLAEVFTLPSFREGLPIALMEAMALGIPSISTKINAIPEAIENLETGLLIEAGDSEGLAQAIRKLKKDKNLREKLSKNGRDHVLERFEQKAVANIAREAYRQALGLD